MVYPRLDLVDWRMRPNTIQVSVPLPTGLAVVWGETVRACRLSMTRHSVLTDVKAIADDGRSSGINVERVPYTKL
jgi:hypothetical protein